MRTIVPRFTLVLSSPAGPPGPRCEVRPDHVRRLDDTAVFDAEREPDELRVRPRERRRRTGALAKLQVSGRRAVRSVPDLLGEHPARVRELLQPVEQPSGVAAASQLVLAAFAGQERPQTADAGHVPAAPILLLAVPIM